MHAIRSSARREAWYSYDDGKRNLNPFGRGFRVRRRTSDEEVPTRTTSNVVPDRIHETRHERNNEAYPRLQRPGTVHPTPESGEQDDLSRGLNVHGDGRYSSGEDTAVTKEQSSADGAPAGLKNSTGTTDFAPDRGVVEGNEKKHGLRSRLGWRRRHHGADGDGDSKPKSRMSKWKKSRLTPWQQFKAVMLDSWINVLLIMVPIGFAINYAHLNGIANFVVNFVAIVPLAAMLSFATEELAKYTNPTLGGLLNATFGNATELIVSIIALKQEKVLIVQTSLIGSMLSNLLLVLGMSFFFGGFNRVKQHFNITVAQTASSMLALSIGSLIIPTAFVRFGSSTDATSAQNGAAPISRGTSIILLLVYASYLVFQLKTHAEMYNEKSEKGEKRHKDKDTKSGIALMGHQAIKPLGQDMNRGEFVQKREDQPQNEDDEEDDEPNLSLIGALITLTAATVAIAFCSEFMVTGINVVGQHISQEFIGLILLPIVGNAAEHATAVTVACKDKMDLAIGVAVGSSMQIALLVLPLMVVIGWCGLGHPAEMTLNFDGFQVTVLFIAVLLVNYLIQDGESHWLEGVLLQATYIIIALTAYYYPVHGEVAG